MTRAAARTRAQRGVRPVVYAGRSGEEVAGLPEGAVVLDEWGVLPSDLAAAAEGADYFLVLDPLSFPFEAAARAHPDVPLVVVFPAEYDADFLAAVFEKPLFGRLDFFDRVAIPNDAVWNGLRRRYGWVTGQRLAPAPTGAEAYAEIPDGDGVSRNPRLEKAVHLAQRAAMEPRFAAARGDREEGLVLDVLEVGAGDGRWAYGLDPAATRYVGLDADEELVRAARTNFAGCPGRSFGRLGEDLALPYSEESFDLVFAVDVLHHHPAPAQSALLSEMWRVARPGGRLTFLQNFVAGACGGRPEPGHVVPVLAFVDLLIGATGGRVLLDHVRSLRYPGDDAFGAAVISLSKLGVPGTW